MNYIRTTKGTNWSKQKLISKLFGILTFPFQANPGYDSKFHLIKEWLVEFDKNGIPMREIGLDDKGLAIISRPDEKNYGFWLDTNMKITDFENNQIDKNFFEEKWNEYKGKSGELST